MRTGCRLPAPEVANRPSAQYMQEDGGGERGGTGELEEGKVLRVAKLRRRPKHFRTFTGLSVEQFDVLLDAVAPVYARLEREKKCRRPRQRAVGAGHPFTLPLPERLLMVLMSLRLYVTETLLGYLFDIDNSTVGRERNHRMMPALLEALPVPLREELGLVGAAQKRGGGGGGGGKKIGTLEELLERFPELKEVLVDATEQPVPRPKDALRQRQSYSGKKKRHTCKTQIAAARAGVVLHQSGSVPGSVQDTVLLRFTGLLHQVPAHVLVRVDRGYEGVEAEFPDARIEKPIKAQRNARVSALGKAYNRMQARLRIPVEHVLARLEKFRVLEGVYRGRQRFYDDCFAVVAGLSNYRVLGRLAW